MLEWVHLGIDGSMQNAPTTRTRIRQQAMKAFVQKQREDSSRLDPRDRTYRWVAPKRCDLPEMFTRKVPPQACLPKSLANPSIPSAPCVDGEIAQGISYRENARPFHLLTSSPFFRTRTIVTTRDHMVATGPCQELTPEGLRHSM